MFVDFFYHLRKRGIPVSPTEFLTLLEALEEGLAASSLTRFYALARAVLVKRHSIRLRPARIGSAYRPSTIATCTAIKCSQPC